MKHLNVKIFADGADLASMLELYKNPAIKGFTTNPTLMRKAGITEYEKFAKEVLQYIPDRPISFEVFADDFTEMERQAKIIASWGNNVYVKIPVTNTKKEPATALIKKLSEKGIKQNVTALMTLKQAYEVAMALKDGPPNCISIFAGRIADTGVDPLPLMGAAVEIAKMNANSELIWASPRELLNIFHADQVGCHIITVTTDILNKMSLIGRDLDDYSLDTVKMFYKDGQAAGFKL